MVDSSKPNPTNYQVRSVSLPSCRSHPSTIRIEQELNKLKTWEVSRVPSDKNVSDGLIGLSTLYVSLDELLNLSSTKEALSHIQKREWIDDLLDRSIRVLDICGTVKDMVSQLKENIINLQCVLRRRNGDSSIESSIDNYITFRKRIKRDIKRILIAKLKKVKSIDAYSLGQNLNHYVISVIRVLMDVNEIVVSVLVSILTYFTTLGLKTKSTKWSLVSKLMSKGVILACEDQPKNVNDMEKVDVALFNIICKKGSNNEVKKLQIAQKSLMAFEVHVESIDKGLESMFRHLIRTRASILNITSH